MKNQTKKPASSDLAAKVLERIEAEQIEPTSKWTYACKNVLLWSGWGVTIIVGAAATSASIYVFANAGWKYYTATHSNFFTFFTQSIPYLWVGTLLIFMTLAYKHFRSTKHGYTFSYSFIVLSSLSLSVAGGVFLYSFGYGQAIDHDFGSFIPMHTSMVSAQEGIWVDADKGFLAGEVVSVNYADQSLVLQSFDGKKWDVSTSDLRYHDVGTLSSSDEIRVVGVITEENGESAFHACLVFPWLSNSNDYTTERTAFLESYFEIPQPSCESFGFSERSSKCKDFHPYQVLENLQEVY